MRTANLSSFLEVLDALEGTGTGAWGWDVATNTIRWSRNTGPLYGNERGFEPVSYEDFLELVHPDDRPTVVAAVERALTHGDDYEFDFRVTWRDGSVHWLNGRGHAITDDAGVTVRIVGVVTEITDRKREADQHRFLVQAAEILASSLEVEETLHKVANLLVAELADWCSLQMVEDGQIRTVAIAHRDPAMLEMVDRLQQEYPPDPEPSDVARVVIETGEALIIDEITDELLAEAAVDDEHLEILRSLGLASALTVPINIRQEVVALLTLVSAESQHRFTAADKTFAEEFARHAALALDNARLHEQAVAAHRRAERSSTRLRAINEVVTKLSRAADVDAVAKAAIESGVGALGADRGAVVMLRDAKLEIVAHTGYTPQRLEHFEAALNEPAPLKEAATAGVTVYCGNVEELLERYPNLGDVMRNSVPGAYVAAPLRTSGGLVGAIGFVYNDSRSFGSDDRTLVAALTQHVALAIERGLLFERNRSVAETLQAALAPPPLVGRSGVPAAVRYRASGVGAIGGDWYDVIDSPDGDQVYVIGDVVGRGLEAVATMAQLRHSLRILLMEGRKPAEALGVLSGVAEIDTTALCSTVLCASVRPGSSQVEVTSSGHLPPVLVGRNGAHLVEMQIGTPLGIGGGPPTHTLTLGEDTCLVLYTDGVIERRDRHIDESLRLLTEGLSGVRPVVEEVADSVLGQAVEADDDATILVIGGPPAPG